MFLSASQIAALTDRIRSPAQRRALDALGIKYGMRADGSLVVLESSVEAALGPASPVKPKKREFVIHVPD